MRQALLMLVAEVAAKVELLARHAREATFKQAVIDKLTREVANLTATEERRHRREVLRWHER